MGLTSLQHMRYFGRAYVGHTVRRYILFLCYWKLLKVLVFFTVWHLLFMLLGILFKLTKNTFLYNERNEKTVFPEHSRQYFLAWNHSRCNTELTSYCLHLRDNKLSNASVYTNTQHSIDWAIFLCMIDWFLSCFVALLITSNKNVSIESRSPTCRLFSYLWYNLSHMKHLFITHETDCFLNLQNYFQLNYAP